MARKERPPDTPESSGQKGAFWNTRFSNASLKIISYELKKCGATKKSYEFAPCV